MADDRILINGEYPDWSSVQVKVTGGLVIGITAVNYKNALNAAMVYGQGGQPIGRTRGQYSSDASITLTKPAYYDLIKKLVPPGSKRGYMEVPFNIVVQTSFTMEGVERLYSDEIVGARIAEDPQDKKPGPDPLSIAVKLTTMYILIDGLPPISNLKR